MREGAPQCGHVVTAAESRRGLVREFFAIFFATFCKLEIMAVHSWGGARLILQVEAAVLWAGQGYQCRW